MDISLNDASTWRRAINVYVNDAGTWRTIQKVWVNDAGTWRQAFQFLTVPAGGANRVVVTPANATASMRFDTDGHLYTIAGTSTDRGIWGAGGAGYEVRATLSSGTTPTTNPGLGTWLNLGTSRTWTNFNNTAGIIITSTILFELGIAGTSTALASGTATILAEVTF